MRASIIIAAHNEGASLWKTIRSCVESIGKVDYEIVIADDASDDESVQEAVDRYPQLTVHQHEQRQGASPTKHLGASNWRGEVLVFLDGHCNPELGGIERLVEDVERLNGQSIVTPTILALDTARWKNKEWQVGHGYRLELDTFDCGWLPLASLRKVRRAGREFYESPAAIGCAFAVHRELYDDLRGVDPHMRIWGVEDLDFSLKCWLMGRSILHDPEARIGHRFREKFDNYNVPVEHILVNKLRMAYKNFTQAVWSEWLQRCRHEHSGGLKEHPEGLWACAWKLFQADHASAEQERAYLHTRRERDEFWYAQQFGLNWPRLQRDELASPRTLEQQSQPEGSSSPSPPPPPVYLNLAGTIELVAPCKDLSLPGFPADSDTPINLKSVFSLKTEDSHTYEYRFAHRVVNKDDCTVLTDVSQSISGEVAPGASVDGPTLNENVTQVPKGIYEYRARIEVRLKDVGGAYTLFVLRSCLFKVGDPKLVGWTGDVLVMKPCGKIDPDDVIGNTKARLKVLEDDPANHQFKLIAQVWDRETSAIISDGFSPEALKPGDDTFTDNVFAHKWPESLYQYIVELRATSGRGTLSNDPCSNFLVLQRLQCFFDSLEE